MIDLALAENIEIGVEHVDPVRRGELHDVRWPPGSGGGERRAPVPAKVGLFFADELAVGKFKHSLNARRPLCKLLVATLNQR